MTWLENLLVGKPFFNRPLERGFPAEPAILEIGGTQQTRSQKQLQCHPLQKFLEAATPLVGHHRGGHSQGELLSLLRRFLRPLGTPKLSLVCYLSNIGWFEATSILRTTQINEHRINKNILRRHYAMAVGVRNHIRWYPWRHLRWVAPIIGPWENHG